MNKLLFVPNDINNLLDFIINKCNVHTSNTEKAKHLFGVLGLFNGLKETNRQRRSVIQYDKNNMIIYL